MSASKPEVTFHGFLDLQVCVPKTLTDAQVEEFANIGQPTGIESGWKVKLESDPTMMGAPQRVQCGHQDRNDCCHIMLSC